MTNTLTARQAAVSNADSFLRQLSILHSAAVGVILCRTREPYRAIDAIKAMAFSKKMPMKMWTVTQGWQTYNPDGTKSEPNGSKDPNMSLQMVGGLDNVTKDEEGEPGMGPGFYVSMYPHHWLKQGQAVPPIVQTIKEYCRTFPHMPNKRLVLVTPVGFSLPAELEEDVTILDFEVPSYAELTSALNSEIGDLPARMRPSFSDDEKDRIIAAGSGMQLSEFSTAFGRAIITNKDALPDVDADRIVEEVMKVKVEVVKRSEVLEVMPVSNMDNVGGLANLKDWTRMRSACFDQEAADYGIDKPKGIALIGPPGTGKSLFAKAIAHLLGKPLIKFDVSRVFAGLVGASEERVRSALKMIDAMAPCVVMLDEVDKAFQRGSGGDSGVSQRVLGSILTHMQESDAGVFWVCTANRVDNLPSEFLRRGRLDEVFSVSVPDEIEREEIIKIHLRMRGKNPDDIEGLEEAVTASEGYVPAELEAAVKDAIIASFADNKSAITGRTIAEQLMNMKPLSEAFAEDFSRMQEWAENNARPASANRAAPTSRRRRRAPVEESTTRQLDLAD